MLSILDTGLIRECREKLGLSMAEAASRGGLGGRAHWYEIETGVATKRGITLGKLLAVSIALQRQPGYFIKKITIPPPRKAA